MSVRFESASATPAYRAGGIAMLLALASILAAIGFERIGGYAPCYLCGLQRIAYYVGLPALFVAMALIAAEKPKQSGFLFFAVGLLFLANSGLGIYHAGIEWKFWPGPDTCSAAMQPIAPAGGGLLKQLETTRVIRCDEAPWRLLGLSFAGWNVVTSFLIFVAALQAAFAAARR